MKMNLLRDPLWQFIGVIATLIGILIALNSFIGTLAAAVALIASLFIFILLYPNIRPNKTIFFRLISDTIILSIKEEKDIKGELRILYKEEDIKEDIHLVIIKLWNPSSSPILSVCRN